MDPSLEKGRSSADTARPGCRWSFCRNFEYCAAVGESGVAVVGTVVDVGVGVGVVGSAFVIGVEVVAVVAAGSTVGAGLMIVDAGLMIAGAGLMIGADSRPNGVHCLEKMPGSVSAPAAASCARRGEACMRMVVIDPAQPLPRPHSAKLPPQYPRRTSTKPPRL